MQEGNKATILMGKRRLGEAAKALTFINLLDKL